MNKPLIINNWQKGIAKSQYLGFADMRNVDNYREAGIAKMELGMQRMTPQNSATTFTADASTDIITVAVTLDNPYLQTDGTPVTLTTSGTLPAGLSTSTTYFLIRVSATTYKLATTLANALAATAINITSAGSGTHTITPTTIGLVRYFAFDSNASVLYAQDSNGRVWYAGSSGASTWYLLAGNTIANGYGLAIWKGYLFSFRFNSIDLYPLAGGSWTNSWNSLKSGSTTGHYPIVMTNDILYCVDESSTAIPFIISLKEVSGSTFDPANGATYSYNTSALDLPKNQTVGSLEQYGRYLAIGAKDKIYLWDTFSDSFNAPINCPEGNITALKTIGNLLYIGTGVRGIVYKTNGVEVGEAFAIPRQINTTTSALSVSGARCAKLEKHFGKLLALFEGQGIGGIWQYDLETNSLIIKSTISSNNASFVDFGSMFSSSFNSSENIHVSYLDSNTATYAIDSYLVSAYNYPSVDYAAVIKTAVYQIGTDIDKDSLNTIEVLLDRPLVNAAQKVRVSYRTNTISSFTTIATFNSDTYPNAQSYVESLNIKDATIVQFQIELDTSTGSNIGNDVTPRLLALIIK